METMPCIKKKLAYLYLQPQFHSVGFNYKSSKNGGCCVKCKYNKVFRNYAIMFLNLKEYFLHGNPFL